MTDPSISLPFAADPSNHAMRNGSDQAPKFGIGEWYPDSDQLRLAALDSNAIRACEHRFKTYYTTRLYGLCSAIFRGAKIWGVKRK